MSSIKIIAEKSGFSIATVSRYINKKGIVREETGLKIERAIKEVGYTPNYIARSLVMQKTNVIGLLVPSLGLSFLASFVDGVEKAAAAKGYTIFLCNCYEDVSMELKYLKLLQDRRVDGIISIPVGADVKVYRELAARIPLVIAIRTYNKIDISSIVNDDYNGARTVVEYLVNKGHRKIAVINGPMSLSTGRRRWEAVCDVLEENGIEVDMKLVRENPYSVDAAYHSMMEILNSGEEFTAVFTANQMICIGVLKALGEVGKSIPQDVSLASFDGFEESYAESLVHPAITANYNPITKLGEMSAELIAEEIERFVKKEQNKLDYVSTKNICIKMEFREKDSVKDITGQKILTEV